MSRLLSHITVLAILVGLSLPLSAQEKPRKELNKLMKEMPLELQQQILTYAQRKKQAYEVAQNRLNTKAVEAEELAKTKTNAVPSMQVKPKPQTPPATATTPTVPNGGPTLAPAEQAAAAAAQTQVSWNEEVHDFGKVSQGTKVQHTFKFKNTGEEPLTLTRVKASCGCTVPRYSREPIAPGAEGSIDVTFNSAGKLGRQVKTVTVTGNFAGQRKVLRIQGEIETPSSDK